MSDYTLLAGITTLSIAGGLYLLSEARFYRSRRGPRLKLFDVVTVLSPIPTHALLEGKTGTVVEILDEASVLIEFAGEDGGAKAVVPMPIVQLARVTTSC